MPRYFFSCRDDRHANKSTHPGSPLFPPGQHRAHVHRSPHPEPQAGINLLSEPQDSDSGHHSALHKSSLDKQEQEFPAQGPQEAAAAVFSNPGAFKALSVIAPRCTLMMESLN